MYLHFEIACGRLATATQLVTCTCGATCPRGRRLVIPGFRAKVFFLVSQIQELISCEITCFIRLYCCNIPPLGNPMDFYNSPAPYTRFGSIILQVDEAHRAVCGGAQGPGALGRLLKIHDFFEWRNYSLRECPRLVSVLQETCLRMPNHASNFLF